MNAESLLAHYERIADAPDAIARLRRFVLDLAVRGKLVPQDPSDEPASELLKRIEKEKDTHAPRGGKKRPDPNSLLDEGLITAIPDKWEWSNLAHISLRLHYGYTASADPKMTAVRLLRITDIQDNRVNWDTVPGCVIDEKSLSGYTLEVGDILIARTGGTIGKTFLVSHVPVTSVFASYLIRVQPARSLFDRYLKVFCESDLYWDQLREGSRGGGQPNVNGQTLGGMFVLVPPLAEQHRIVGKVDELMALCDRMEAVRTEREATRNKLTAASLARLNAPDPETFQDDARFMLDALPALTTRRDQIRHLRQTIRNLAVSGNLVPQDPNEEPASELLKRIAAEKARLVKLGEIKRERNSKYVDPKVLLFEIKSGWVATTIETILIELQTGPFGSSLHQSDYQMGGVSVVNPASIQNERIVPIEKMAVGASTLKRLSSFRLREGDIVMGRRGEMGRCAVVTEREVGWLCGTGSLILRLPCLVSGRFFVLLIGSPYVRDYLGGSAVGATMQNLNQGILLNLVVGLPPFAEQRRIVAKVDELMVLCDRLEASIATGEEVRRRLLDALLAEALEPVKGDLEQAA
jgi:type I restriction enzyme S subunit